MKHPRLIGVIHLPALAGSPGAHRDHPAMTLQKAGLWAVKEAKLLEQAGFEGIILENFGDHPFYKTQVPAETIASLAVITAAVRESTRLVLGVNVLRNDATSALAIAAVTGCEFIRVNVLSGVSATDQGIIEGDAARLLRGRDQLGADIGILADVHVKHAKSLSSDSLELAIEETALRGMADGVILTGSTTGRAVDPSQLQEASEACRRLKVPLYIGSGATLESLAELKRLSPQLGVIVGSALRRGGRAGEPLDPARTRAFAQAFFKKSSVTSKKKKKKSNSRR